MVDEKDRKNKPDVAEADIESLTERFLGKPLQFATPEEIKQARELARHWSGSRKKEMWEWLSPLSVIAHGIAEPVAAGMMDRYARKREWNQANSIANLSERVQGGPIMNRVYQPDPSSNPGQQPQQQRRTEYNGPSMEFGISDDQSAPPPNPYAGSPPGQSTEIQRQPTSPFGDLPPDYITDPRSAMAAALMKKREEEEGVF